jgi:hypothetical protein
MSCSLRYLLGCVLAAFPVLTGHTTTSTATNLERTSPILTPTNSDAAYGVGYWIWAEHTLDKQTCRFWKTVTIPRGAVAVEARVRTTADNSYRFFLDDQEVTQGSAWESMTECDLTAFMKPGVHVLALEAFNDYSAAGALVAMRIELADGQVMKIGSDRSWYLVPLDDNNWRTKTKPETGWIHSKVLGPFGTPPWQRVGRILKLAPVQPVVLKFWQRGWFQISILSVCVAAVLISLYLLNRLAVQSKAQEMLQVERARIARDFHDDLGARITQLVLLTEVARRNVSANLETQPKLDQLCTRMRDLSGAIKVVTPPPVRKSVFWDEDPRSIDNGAFGIKPAGTWVWWNLPASTHNRGCAMSYLDGHTEIWKWKDTSVLAIGQPQPPLGTGMNSPAPVGDRDLIRVQTTVPPTK